MPYTLRVITECLKSYTVIWTNK